MASFAFTDATCWVHGYDFTTDLNQMAVNVTADELDNTTFGSGGFRSRAAGLRTVASKLDGFWQGTPDSEAFTDLGTADRAVTIAPTSTETSTAYMFQAGKFTYNAFGADGDMTPFSLGMASTNGVGVVRGQVAKARGSVNATGVLGSVVNVGAPSATQFVYCTVHVFTAGTTMTLQLQSDTAANFPSPTTQATIAGLTATGGTWMTRVAGALTGEAYWRLNISAITGTFSVAAAIAVQ